MKHIIFFPVIGKTYQNSSITLTPAALTYYQNRSFNVGSSARSASTALGGPPPPPSSTIGLEVTYNTFKSPVTIKERGGDETYIDYIDFVYNDGNDRSTMFYGGLDDDKLLRRYRKHYSADGSMEIKEDQISGTVEFITYIGGDGYTAPLIVKSDGLNPENYYYLHRDYQGSIMTITNNLGMIEEKRLFDAWGAIITVENGNGLILNGLTIIDRGYTGHEHIQSMGLINMNGRLYDPKLHRFLQPDNLVQQLENTQNYNRYGYVLNNPLKYTDPSGEEAITLGVAVIIAAAIAITSYTLNALVADVPFTIGGLVKATFVGAATAVVTFGVGRCSKFLVHFSCFRFLARGFSRSRNWCKCWSCWYDC
jgi:RHS repeat-associated protein